MPGPPHIAVLLSTYNGARFLSQQVQSVLGQRGVSLALWIRDDGSSDETRSILASYAADPRVRVLLGHNIGAAASFFTLLQAAEGEADAMAFADQDDVWFPDHLHRATTALHNVAGVPALWCSRPLVVDEELNALAPLRALRRPPSFSNALVENIAAGCTTVMNARAAAVLASRLPHSPVMHDAWAYLVVSGTGVVLHDAEPSVCYRMHGTNAVGLSRSSASRLWQRLRRLTVTPHAGAWSRQAADLESLLWEELRPPAQVALRSFTSARRTVRGRIAYALKGEAHRQGAAETLAMKVLFALGRI